jgi:hypothetical protein
MQSQAGWFPIGYEPAEVGDNSAQAWEINQSNDGHFAHGRAGRRLLMLLPSQLATARTTGAPQRGSALELVVRFFRGELAPSLGIRAFEARYGFRSQR